MVGLFVLGGELLKYDRPKIEVDQERGGAVSTSS